MPWRLCQTGAPIKVDFQRMGIETPLGSCCYPFRACSGKPEAIMVSLIRHERWHTEIDHACATHRPGDTERQNGLRMYTKQHQDELGPHLLQRPRGGRSCVLQCLALPHTFFKGLRRLHKNPPWSCPVSHNSRVFWCTWPAGPIQVIKGCTVSSSGDSTPTRAMTGVTVYLRCRV